MDMLKQLNGALSYIEKNLAGEISLEKAAEIACVTQDSFQRFFSYMVGMTLTEYIRRRRLTLAAEELRRDGGRVLDVALRYGYENADAFSRAFSKQHGVTPAAFRKSGGPLKNYPPAAFYIVIKGAKKMNFQIADVQETVVYGLSKEFDEKLYPTREALRYAMWDEKSGEEIPSRLCEGRWNQKGNQAYDGVWYALWRNGRYLIGRERELTQAEGLERQTIPAGKYAVFISEKGGYAGDEIPKLFSLIFDSWLPTSGYRRRGEDIIEVYHLWTDKATRKENRYYEVWLPIE